jgi:TPR repeat protein
MLRQSRSLLRRAPLNRIIPSTRLVQAVQARARLPTITPSPSPIRLYATTVDGKPTGTHENLKPPEMEKSLEAIIPEILFTEGSAEIPQPLAKEVVSVILQQLRDGVDVKTREEAVQLEQKANEKVKDLINSNNLKSASLHQFTVSLLKHSRDPRRLPIASRLFLVAFDRDPLTMPDPTAATMQEGSPLHAATQWGTNAAGYNWASMVLSGQASPPVGLQLLQRGSAEAREAIKDQQAAAIRVYATLATQGDAQGMLGMGRILLASARKTDDGKEDEQTQKAQSEMMKNRAIALWTKAGEKGLSEAWFELGLLSLNSMKEGGAEEENVKHSQTAQGYFERGADKENVRCHHALAIMLAQRAMMDNTSPSSPERNLCLEKAVEHFKKAANLGDGQSAHEVGMRYLLRQEMLEEIGLGSESDGRDAEKVRQQAKDRHLKLWGVESDDVTAKEWFSKGADAGFMPAMMNYAGMLYEGRGATPIAANEDAKVIRLKELKKAESLYAKVAAQAGIMAQQQQKSMASGNEDQMASASAQMTAEMATFAQDALGKVQEAVKELTDDV